MKKQNQQEAEAARYQNHKLDVCTMASADSLEASITRGIICQRAQEIRITISKSSDTVITQLIIHDYHLLYV